jgi:hypothetical protein
MRAELRFTKVSRHCGSAEYVCADSRLCGDIRRYYDIGRARSFWLVAGTWRPKGAELAVYTLSPSDVGHDPWAAGGVRIGDAHNSVLVTRAGRWLREQMEAGARYVWIEVRA